jgi:hypothetical protein
MLLRWWDKLDAWPIRQIFFPAVHEIKEYRGSRGISPLVDNFGTRGWVINFKPRERTPLPIEKEAVWHPEQVRLFWRREKSLVSARIQTPHRPARSIVTLPNNLSCPPPPLQLNFRGDTGNEKQKNFSRKKKIRNQLEDLGVDGQQMGLELVREGAEWINAAQDKDQLWTAVNTTMISPG